MDAGGLEGEDSRLLFVLPMALGAGKPPWQTHRMVPLRESQALSRTPNQWPL